MRVASVDTNRLVFIRAIAANCTRLTSWAASWAALLALALLLSFAMVTFAQTGASGPASSAVAAAVLGSAPVKTEPPHAKVPTRANPTFTQGLHWRDLSVSQRTALKPLEHDWAGLDTPRRQKWVQLADRLPGMLPAEQARVQARMADWAKLTPQQRGQTRLNFQEATQVPSQDRQARWDAYQALTPEQKRELAARAAPRTAAPASGSPRRPSAVDNSAQPGEGSGHHPVHGKSNLVPNPVFANRPNAISPTVIRASPGATTTTISKPAVPPSHQQAGMPKIAATPAFVDKTTLLPLRGPQGAAIRSPPASAAVPGASGP